MAFLHMWWTNSATDVQKEKWKKFVSNGQIEFVTGGWSMSDEANTHYISTLDNHSLGHRFIVENFGVDACPVIGWQIDPFGHSNWFATAFSEMGFIGEFFARIDDADFARRLENKSLEMIWRGNTNRPIDSDIFTHKLYHHYSPFDGFNFETNATNPDDPSKKDPDIIDDGSPDDNHIDRVQEYINAVLDQAEHYQTNNVLTLMGQDFTFKTGSTWFQNMDKLIKYANELDDRVNIFYSTPSIYTRAVNSASNDVPTAAKPPPAQIVDWSKSLKVDDFFPYGTGPHSYWVG